MQGFGFREVIWALNVVPYLLQRALKYGPLGFLGYVRGIRGVPLCLKANTEGPCNYPKRSTAPCDGFGGGGGGERFQSLVFPAISSC